jgi:hypothetical protein
MPRKKILRNLDDLELKTLKEVAAECGENINNVNWLKTCQADFFAWLDKGGKPNPEMKRIWGKVNERLEELHLL